MINRIDMHRSERGIYIMKMMNLGKKAAAALAALLLLFSAACVTAEETSAATSDTVLQLIELRDFKFFHKGDGIGGNKRWPVYTAPSEDSLRLADGKAWCNPSGEMSVGGHAENGWLLVRYKTPEEYTRVGYVPSRYLGGIKTGVGGLDFARIPVKAAEEIFITDDLDEKSPAFGKLEPGESFDILAKYTYYGNWWYIETTVEGKTARGFINRGTAAIEVDGKVYHGNAELGLPEKSPLGTEKTGTVTVTSDDATIVHSEPDPAKKMVARVFKNDTFPCYGSAKGSTKKDWYYIWVDGVWGWISSGRAQMTPDE